MTNVFEQEYLKQQVNETAKKLKSHGVNITDTSLKPLTDAAIKEVLKSEYKPTVILDPREGAVRKKKQSDEAANNYFKQIGGEHGPHTPSDWDNIPDPEYLAKEKEKGTKKEPAIGPATDYPEEDLINEPNHYHHGGFDVYEWMQDKFTVEEYRGFCIGNMEKYLQRHKLKNDPAENLEKLRFNVDRLIESYRGIRYVPEHKKTQEEWDI